MSVVLSVMVKLCLGNYFLASCFSLTLWRQLCNLNWVLKCFKHKARGSRDSRGSIVGVLFICYSWLLFCLIIVFENILDQTSSKHTTPFSEKCVCVGIGFRNALITTGSQSLYQHFQCLLISRYSLSISYMLGPLLGPSGAIVNSDKSPAIGKPSLVVSKSYETLIKNRITELHALIGDFTTG